MEKMDFCPYFFKNLTQCFCFEIIKHRVPVFEIRYLQNRVLYKT